MALLLYDCQKFTELPIFYAFEKSDISKYLNRFKKDLSKTYFISNKTSNDETVYTLSSRPLNSPVVYEKIEKQFLVYE